MHFERDLLLRLDVNIIDLSVNSKKHQGHLKM